MKKFKKLSALFLSVLLLLSCMTITAYAAQSAAQDGLSAVIETDKETYDANEPILVTVKVTNTNSFAMKNVSIESILPAELTLQDGTLKSDTVDLEAGEELTLTFTAVLEKEVPPVTEPGTSEPDTSEPDTTEPVVTEPDTTEPTVTNPSEPDTTEPAVTDPGETDPSETEPTVTEPTVTNPTTQPATENPTAAGEVTTTEEQTTLTTETTTAVNAADHVNGTSPITGAPAVALKVLLVVVMVAAVAFAVVMLTRKNGKKATKIISVVLSAVICGSSLVTTGMIAKAEENTRSFSVDKTITVDGEDYTLSANVIYDKPETEETDTWYQDVDENHVAVSESGVEYIDNHIVVTFYEDTTDTEKNAVVDAVNGKIVGKKDTGTQYQIEIPQTKNIKELQEICDKVSNMSGVFFAFYETVQSANKILQSVVPNDPWTDLESGVENDWNELDPSGLNWWLETIKAPSAWEYNERFKNIKIGVVDAGFDTNHEDLDITVLNPNENNEDENSDHGTHVSGIIGANANNDKGITGIVWNKDLYGVDVPVDSDEPSAHTSILSAYDGIERVLQQGCKVINKSLGDNIKNKEDIIESGTTAIHYLLYWQQEFDRSDFIIVQSAGNNGQSSLTNGTFSSIYDDSIQDFWSGLDEQDKKEYNLSDISDLSIVYDHFMIVGAIDKPSSDGTYSLTNFSNYGAHVDIVAPGNDVYSTVYTGNGVNESNYALKSGTSMAAPMATGVAGLVWSVNPSFSANDVKSIVCNSISDYATGYGNDHSQYPMLNANLAVHAAIIKTPTSYGVTGAVLAEDTKEPIANATVSVYDGNTLLGQTQTDENGTYKLTLNSDTTSSHFTLEVYKPDRWPYIDHQLELQSGSTVELPPIYMKLWDSGLDPGENPTPDDNFAGGDGSVENPYQIATARQLDAVRNHLDSNFVLVNDIDLSEYSNWVPIGGNKPLDKCFSGNFDGGGHTIRYFRMHYYTNSAPFYIGLFGLTSDNTEIKNLKLEDVSISIGKSAIIGAICASADKVENCEVTGDIWCYNARMLYVAGIVGTATIVENCESYVNISVSDGAQYVAGIAANANRATSCRNYGNISIKDSVENPQCFYAGIIAHAKSNCPENFEVFNCNNFGSINIDCALDRDNTSLIIGGIAGFVYTSSDKPALISNSNNYGNISLEVYTTLPDVYNSLVIGGILGETTSGAITSNIVHCGNFGDISVCTQCSHVDLTGLASGSKNEQCINVGNLIIHDSDLSKSSAYVSGIGGTAVNCYNLAEKIGLERTVAPPNYVSNHFYRISSVSSNSYSLDSTLINGEIVKKDIGLNRPNGGSMTRAEIEKAVTDLGFELPA